MYFAFVHSVISTASHICLFLRLYIVSIVYVLVAHILNIHNWMFIFGLFGCRRNTDNSQFAIA